MQLQQFQMRLRELKKKTQQLENDIKKYTSIYEGLPDKNGVVARHYYNRIEKCKHQLNELKQYKRF